MQTNVRRRRKVGRKSKMVPAEYRRTEDVRKRSTEMASSLGLAGWVGRRIKGK